VGVNKGSMKKTDRSLNLLQMLNVFESLAGINYSLFSDFFKVLFRILSLTIHNRGRGSEFGVGIDSKFIPLNHISIDSIPMLILNKKRCRYRIRPGRYDIHRPLNPFCGSAARAVYG